MGRLTIGQWGDRSSQLLQQSAVLVDSFKLPGQWGDRSSQLLQPQVPALSACSECLP
ncbi:MAG: hypothetical protein SNJ81_20295 [Cyanobacteriota bacterium]